MSSPHEREAVEWMIRKLKADARAAEALAEKAELELETARLVYEHVKRTTGVM